MSGKGHWRRPSCVSDAVLTANDKRIFNRIEVGDKIRLTGSILGRNDLRHCECCFNNDEIEIMAIFSKEHAAISTKNYGLVTVSVARIKELLELQKEKKI